MAISKTLQYGKVDELWLDPKNPRIGRAKRRENPTQESLLRVMSTWTLEELVDSFLNAGGFWTQDALIVVSEPIDNVPRLIVVEGNRRLAALKLMKAAIRREAGVPPVIQERMAEAEIAEDDDLFENIPYLLADQRSDIDAYLGFRHVTGIIQWAPAEKAEFITKLIESQNLSYKEVGRQIGSRADVVRNNYVAFKILQQIEVLFDEEHWAEIEDKFSVLFLAVKSNKVRDFLGIDVNAIGIHGAHDPIPEGKQEDLSRFIGWVFGTKDRKPIVRDSRQIDRFAEILSEERSVQYLKENAEPQFEVAYALTKAAADLVIDPLREAGRQITLALSEIGGRANDEDVSAEAWPVIEGGAQLALVTNGENLSRVRELISDS